VDVLSIRNCTAGPVLLLTIASLASGQTPAPATPATGDSSLTIFIRGVEVGRMQSNLARADSTWVLTSTGRFGDLVLNRFEMKYDADWQPLGLRLEVTQGQRATIVSTSFGLTTAVNEITQNGATSSKTDQISARTVVLPNNFYAAYEALAVRLATASPGTEIPIYVPPQGEVKVTVKDVSPETIQASGTAVSLRKFTVVLHNVGADLDATIAIDAQNRFARLEIPAATLAVARSDLASVGARRQTVRNSTDVDVSIPASGFNIAGTLTMPKGEGRLRHPTVVLAAGSGPVDRDETVAGIPIFAQLAGALAERGFMVLRYDKRGIGQSGGRIETVTLEDYADDVIAIIKWLGKRDDVDPRRMTVVGHSEGGSVAMIAAAKEKKIASIVLVGATGSTGADLVLEQQRHQLDLMKLPDTERQQKIDLQQKVQTAVITEKGWDGVPEEVRRQADTAWFKSLLQFDPARVMPQIKQPILILQGDLDTQVPPHHAEQLAELARKRKKAPPIETVHLPGVNHLLVKATTGEVQEYAQLTEKTITPDVATTIAEWLKR
jgi:pimeloyl-ACP methyl ester carboxylesterase